MEGACASVLFHKRTYPKLEKQSLKAADTSALLFPDFSSLPLEVGPCLLLPVRLWTLSLIPSASPMSHIHLLACHLYLTPVTSAYPFLTLLTVRLPLFPLNFNQDGVLITLPAACRSKCNFGTIQQAACEQSATFTRSVGVQQIPLSEPVRFIVTGRSAPCPAGA